MKCLYYIPVYPVVLVVLEVQPYPVSHLALSRQLIQVVQLDLAALVLLHSLVRP